MKNLKDTSRGITLVALVITIIIIIILAVVAISFAFGENGLIKRAEDAGSYYANDTAYTEGSITNVESYINDILGGSTSGGKTLVQAFNEGILQAGDYVNYKPEPHNPVTVETSETGYTNSRGMSESTNQTYSQDENTTWRVLGLSEDGNHLLLTSGSPIKKDGEDPYLVLESAAGAANCVEVLNKVSGIYHNGDLAEETRSMTIEDLERVIGDMTVEYPQEGEHDTGKVYFTSDESKTPIGQTTRYPSYTYRDGDYTLTNPPQVATAGTEVDANAWMFMYTTEMGGDTRADYIPERVYDMLFSGTTESSNYAKSYWLASPGVDANLDIAYFGSGVVHRGLVASGGSYLFHSDGDWYALGFAVRPVVVLKSNIQYGEGAGQLKKIEDQTEDPWTGYEGGQSYGRG